MISVKIARVLLKITGWKKIGDYPGYKKSIFIIAPHTSFWDFAWGKLFYLELGLKSYFFIKKEVFFFPLGNLLTALGAIPVDRGRKNNLVEDTVEEFKKRDNFVLTITPEGTRKKIKKWKRGFYHIAIQANVPIVIGFVDYKLRTYGIKDTFVPSGDFDEDIKKIKRYYIGVSGKYPECFTCEE